ncbi:OX-2 membrane glycoprotein isoform X4 [Apteryx mantelli]|uniref:OX-2 membrane glycoprotein isoform X4 n=1 Tax=Apteryx mantelli TaxID=2696672 RepID=A0ABM4EVB8_9AVES
MLLQAPSRHVQKKKAAGACPDLRRANQDPTACGSERARTRHWRLPSSILAAEALVLGHLLLHKLQAIHLAFCGSHRAPCAALLSVKGMLPSKMTFQALLLSLFCVVLGKPSVVTQTGHREVKMGDNVTLSCVLTEPKDILQVTWQKDSEKSRENIATYSNIKGLRIHEPFQDRMNFTSLVLNETNITFWDARMDDTGCYICLFNVFPLGSFSGRTCLSVFGLNASVYYNISEGHLTAICNAVGLPEPTISWNGLFNSTPTQEEVRHSNGMVSITSKVEIYDTRSLRKQELTCKVSNKNEEMELPLKMRKEESFSFLGLMITLGILLVVFVLIVMAVWWRKRICKRGQSAEMDCLLLDTKEEMASTTRRPTNSKHLAEREKW